MEATARNRYSLLVSLFFHGAIIILLVFLGLYTPLPLPEEQGIAINFGTTENGFGLTEPNQQEQQTVSQNNKEGILTQNIEDASVIKQNNVNQEQQQVNNQTQEEQQQVNQNALFPVNQGNNSNNEGNTEGVGNKGDSNGDPNAESYVGTNGQGNSYSLAGRKIKGVLPKPNYPGNEQGKVVVEIFVDRSGIIVRATAGIKGSTLLSKKYLDAAYNAALKAKFDANPDAAELQKGTITYKFILQ